MYFYPDFAEVTIVCRHATGEYERFLWKSQIR